MLSLLARYPNLAFPAALPIGSYPTPVEPAPALAEAAGFEEVWLKRDDLSAARYGGNKVRRLELLLGEAQAQGARGVWTVGPLGSNHALATALYGREAGLDVHLHHFSQEMTETARLNCLIATAHATRCRLGSRAGLPMAIARARLEAALGRRRGAHIYYIPAGGTCALGDLGYVNAGLELAEQVARGEIEAPDAVVVPVGSGGTLAGLSVGLGMGGLDCWIWGVRVVPRIVASRPRMEGLIRRVRHRLEKAGVGVGDIGRARPFVLDGRQLGRGYGASTEAADRACALVRDRFGLGLETTYSGKALAALLGGVPGGLPQPRRVLYVVTVNTRPLEPLLPEGFGWQQSPAAYHRYLAPRALGSE